MSLLLLMPKPVDRCILKRMADEVCPTCKFPLQYVGDDQFCSQFCALVPDREFEEFKKAKPGDYCVYPCSECGNPIEGEWFPDNPKQTRCAACGPKVRLCERTKLLEEALPHLPAELRARVEEALKS